MQGNDRSAMTAAAILRFRRARSEILPAELFHEPAWDLLLELFVADAQGRRLTGRQVSEQNQVPPNVMSRWLMHLTRVHLIIGDGVGDLDDELTLSGKAFETIERLMREARILQEAIS
jgi:hypothetical protein